MSMMTRLTSGLSYPRLKCTRTTWCTLRLPRRTVETYNIEQSTYCARL